MGCNGLYHQQLDLGYVYRNAPDRNPWWDVLALFMNSLGPSYWRYFMWSKDSICFEAKRCHETCRDFQEAVLQQHFADPWRPEIREWSLRCPLTTSDYGSNMDPTTWWNGRSKNARCVLNLLGIPYFRWPACRIPWTTPMDHAWLGRQVNLELWRLTVGHPSLARLGHGSGTAPI